MQNLNQSNSRSHIVKAIFICSVASLFYLYDFLVRVMPSAMTSNLMASFQIKATGLGILSSLFFWGYIIFQVPGGALYDRYSPRLTLTLATFISGIATVAFALSPWFGIAAIMRFMVGASSAFAFVGAVYMGSMWFKSEHLPTYTGVVQLVGCAGAIIGQGPIAALTTSFGWRATGIGIGALGVTFAVMMLLVVRAPQGYKKTHQASQQQTQSKIIDMSVFRKPQIWLIGLYGFFIWAPTVVFASLWGVPFFETALNLSRVAAASMVSIIWIGIAVGGPCMGWWSNAVKKRRPPSFGGACIGFVASIAIIYFAHSLPSPVLSICLVLFGMGSSSQVICFGFISDFYPKFQLGTAIAFANSAVIMGGVLIQPVVGVILDAFGQQGLDSAGIPLYSMTGFQTGLSIIPLCFLGAMLVSRFGLKETNCEHQY